VGVKQWQWHVSKISENQYLADICAEVRFECVASKCGVHCEIAPQVSLNSCVEFIIDALANVKIYNGYVMVIASQNSLGVEMCRVVCAEIHFIAEVMFSVFGQLSFLPLYIYSITAIFVNFSLIMTLAGCMHSRGQCYFLG
jgi:hypothetical protein